MFGMLPLIATIVLAVVVVVSIAAYTGGIFTESSAAASAQQSINEGEQIYNAIQMYRLQNGSLPDDGSGNLDMNKILGGNTYYTGEYGSWSYANQSVNRSMSQENSCKIINKDRGYEGPVPACSSVPSELESEKFYCCSN